MQLQLLALALLGTSAVKLESTSITSLAGTDLSTSQSLAQLRDHTPPGMADLGGWGWPANWPDEWGQPPEPPEYMQGFFEYYA